MADKETTDSSVDGGLTRRDALVKAGVVAAGAVAAGSVAGSATAARKRSVAQAPRRGGRITWALEQDPVHVAPFGAILTANHWGKQAAYDSLVEWDRNLNLKPALAESWRIVPTRSRSSSTSAGASGSTTARSSTPATSSTRSS